MPPTPNTEAQEVKDIAGLAGLVREVKVEVEKGEERYTALTKDLGDTRKQIDEWLKGIEARVAKAEKAGAAGHGVSEGAALKSAIPARHLKALEMYARTTVKRERAIRLCAMESWLKNSVWLSNPQFAARYGAKALEEMDAIERALGFEPVQKAALQEDTNSEGGYLVPAPVEAEVLRLAEDAGVMRGLCRVVPMTTKSHLFPDLATNVVVNLTAEEGTITQQEPTFGQKLLTARKITCRAITSMELVQDAAIGILSFLMELMTEKKELKVDQQILEGDGTGSQFTGAVAAADVNEVTNGTNGALFTPAKALDQKWKARKQASRRGAAWIAAPEIVQQIEKFRADAAAAADAAGAFLYMNMGAQGQIQGIGNGPSPDGILHGFPIYAHSEIKIDRAVGSATNCSNMYFGPWRTAAIIGDLLGLVFGVSEHTQWANGQLDLRMIQRTAGLISVPKALTKQTGLKIA